MSIFVIAALSLAGASPVQTDTVITAADRPAVAAAARRFNVPSRMLYRAITAPETPRRSEREVRHCLPLASVVEGKSGSVCHRHSEWASFGLFVLPAGRG